VLCCQVESTRKSIAVEAVGTKLVESALSGWRDDRCGRATASCVWPQRGERLRAVAQAHSRTVLHVVFIDIPPLVTIVDYRLGKTWSTDLSSASRGAVFAPECRLWIDMWRRI